MDKEKSGQIQVYGLFHCPFPEKLWSESGIPELGQELSGVGTAGKWIEDSVVFQWHGNGVYSGYWGLDSEEETACLVAIFIQETMEHLVSIRPECLFGLRCFGGGSGADEKGKGAFRETEAEAWRMQNCGCGGIAGAVPADRLQQGADGDPQGD